MPATHEAGAAAACAIDSPSLGSVLNPVWLALIWSTFGVLLLASFIALTIVMKFTNMLPGGQVAAIAIGVIAGVFVGLQLVSLIFDPGLSDLIPTGIDSVIDTSFTMAEFVIALSVALAGMSRAWKTVDRAVANLYLAVLSLIVLSASQAYAGNRQDRAIMERVFLMDLIAVAFAFGGSVLGMDYDFEPGVGVGSDYSLLAPVANALSTADKFMSVSAALADGTQLLRLSRGG